MSVSVRCGIGALGVSTVERAETSSWVKHRIKTLVGITCDVEVLNPEAIERTLVGKARRVIDQRPR